jgi:hypothetical protein
MNLQEIIKDLQIDLDKNPKLEDKYYLVYSQMGWCMEAVEFVILIDDLNITFNLWDSENDSREWDDEANEYEDFKKFFIRKIEKSVKAFKIVEDTLKNIHEDDVIDMLYECKNQLEYLNEKQERGTTNAVLSRLDTLLQKLSK